MKSKKRWKALLRKLDYLRLELEDARESMAKYEEEFSQAVSNIESPPPPDPQENGEKGPDGVVVRKPDQVIDDRGGDPAQQDDVEPDEQVDNRPESFKKLWKLIAAKTHPDVTHGDPELMNIYKEASKAWKRAEIEKLLDYAAELGIELPEPDEALIKTLQKRCQALETELQQITGSPLWEWGNGDDAYKKSMIDGVVERRAARRKK